MINYFSLEIDPEKLIALVAVRPAIYDYTRKDHADRNVVNSLWTEIAVELECSINDCRQKWVSLRNSYSRSLRESNLKSGSSAKQKKVWYLQGSMNFLKDFVSSHRNMTGNYKNVDEEGTSESGVTECEVNIDEGEEQEYAPTQQRKKKKSSAETVAGSMLEYLKERRKDTSDPDTEFMRSLVPDIQKLSESRKRKLKIKIMEMVDKALEEQQNTMSPSDNVTTDDDYVYTTLDGSVYKSSKTLYFN